MSEENLGIIELKDVAALAIELCDCATIVAREGSLGFQDFGNLWGVVERIGPAFKGIEKIPKELKDLSPEECDELIKFICLELTVLDDKARSILGKILTAIKACYEVYLATRV